MIGCDLWSDEPGFAEATATIGVTGICGSGIIEAIAEMFLVGIVSEDGVIDGALAERTQRVEQVGRTFAYVLHEGAPRLLIYQTDVRAIQLAKAALYAGAKLLIERAGAAPERITLAGAFGSHIDPALRDDARPHSRLRSRQGRERRQRGGNRRAHRAPQSRRAGRDRGRRAANREDRDRDRARFQRHFVAAMAFPNKEDAFPNLSQRIELPARKEPAGEGGRRRRRSASPETA